MAARFGAATDTRPKQAGIVREWKGRTTVKETVYEIVVVGRLSDAVQASVHDFTVTYGGGRTTLRGVARDQAHLLGIVDHLARLGISIVSVQPAGAE